MQTLSDLINSLRKVATDSKKVLHLDVTLPMGSTRGIVDDVGKDFLILKQGRKFIAFPFHGIIAMTHSFEDEEQT